MRRDGGAILPLVAAALVTGVPCHAGGGEFAVDVRCPALSAEVDAELEARVRVDLSLRSSEGGALEIGCREREARVVWRPHGRGAFTRAVPIDAGRLVDALLVAVAEVAEESAVAARSESAPEPVAPVVAGAVVSPGNYNTSGEQAATPPAAIASWPAAAGISIGANAAVFSNGQGAIGPNVGLLLALPSNLVAGIHGEYGLALGGADAVRIRIWGGTVSLSQWLGDTHTFEVGAGASAGAVETSASEPFGPSGQTAAYFAVLVRGRYALQNHSVRVALGPELRLYTAPVTVAVDGAPVWKLPSFTAALTLDMTTRLYGDLW